MWRELGYIVYLVKGERMREMERRKMVGGEKWEKGERPKLPLQNKDGKRVNGSGRCSTQPTQEGSDPGGTRSSAFYQGLGSPGGKRKEASCSRHLEGNLFILTAFYYISWLMRGRQPRLTGRRREAGRMSGRRLLRSAVSRSKRSREPKKCQGPRSHL